MTTDNKTQERNNQRNNQNRRNSRPRRNRDNDEFSYVENVIKIRRVSKTVKGGRNLSFNAMVAVGDGAGKVGIALASATAVPDAVQRAVKYAKDKKLVHHVRISIYSKLEKIKPAAKEAIKILDKLDIPKYTFLCEPFLTKRNLIETLSSKKNKLSKYYLDFLNIFYRQYEILYQ